MDYEVTHSLLADFPDVNFTFLKAGGFLFSIFKEQAFYYSH